METFIRECGDCTVCCNMTSIDDTLTDGTKLIKEGGENCGYLNKNCTGCSLYEMRPKTCRSFDCSWLQGYGSTDDRPNKNGLLVYEQDINNGHWIIFLETKENAILNSKSIVEDIMNKKNTAGIVVEYGSEDFIGDLTVVKNKDLERAKTMVGEKVGMINEDIGVYKLIR
jgi:hypothetical protein